MAIILIYLHRDCCALAGYLTGIPLLAPTLDSIRCSRCSSASGEANYQGYERGHYNERGISIQDAREALAAYDRAVVAETKGGA